MKHLQKQFERICWDYLMKIAGNEKHRVTLDVGGPGLVVIETGPCTGWYLALGLEHDVLIDQPIIVSTIPLGSVRPLQADWEMATKLVFEDAMTEREKMNNPQVPVNLQQKFPAVAPERPKAPPRERVSHFKSDPATKNDFGAENANQ